MHKTYKYLIILLLLICILAVVVWIKNRTSTQHYQEKYFGFKQSEVKEIKIQNTKQSSTLSLYNNEWYAQKSKADAKKVDAFFEAQKRIEILAPASPNVAEDLMNQEADEAVSVCIKFLHGKDICYQIVYDSLNSKGTWLIIEKESKAFRIFMPGYDRDDLVGLYITNPAYWIDNLLFSIKREHIKKLSVTWIQQPQYSFFIDNTDGENPQIFSQSDTVEPIKAPKNKLINYLTYYQEIRYQTLNSEKMLKTFTRDKTPYASIEIELKENKTQKADFYSVYQNGVNEVDPNQIAVILQSDNIMRIVNFIDVAVILQKISYFK